MADTVHMTDTIDYGPLAELIGIWSGDKGLDVSPEPDGSEDSAYYETLTFEAIGDVTNAGSQTLAVLHYRQIVQRSSDAAVFHDETGYWMWDARHKIIMHSLTIPRGVSVLAGGSFDGATSDDGRVTLKVSAGLEDESWKIIQSPFMGENASTTHYEQTIQVGGGRLSYSQTMILDIYGKTFEHTDHNDLLRS